jgi:peptidoglycan/xylan/chitin deacetylase (PgdA/CDA1 family)
MIGFLGRVGGILPLKLLQPGAGGPLFLPFYHLVSDDPAPHVRHLYPVVSSRRFRADLEWILRHYEPVELAALGQVRYGGKPVFHLSFDDGLRQCAEVVAPILIEMGIPATFFINPSFVDNQGLMYRYKASLLAEFWPDRKREVLSIGYSDRAMLDEIAQRVGLDFGIFLSTYRPYMGIVHLNSLAQQGFTLGGHSLDHPMYKSLEIAEQVRQTVESVEWVGSRWKMPAAFAFPFTDDGVSSRFFRSLPGDWMTFGTAGIKLDEEPGHFQRVPMERYSHPAQRMVPGLLLAYWMKHLIGRGSVRR